MCQGLLCDLGSTLNHIERTSVRRPSKTHLGPQGFNSIEPCGHAPILKAGDRKQGASDMWQRQLDKSPAAAPTFPPAPRGRTRDQLGVWRNLSRNLIPPSPSSLAGPVQRCQSSHAGGALPTFGLSACQTHKGLHNIPRLTGPRPSARCVRCPHRSSCQEGVKRRWLSEEDTASRACNVHVSGFVAETEGAHAEHKNNTGDHV